MTEAQHPPSGSSDEPTLDSDLNVRLVGWLTVGLLILIAVALVLMWWLGFGVKDRLVAQDPPPPALPEARTEHRPPGPNLQVDPRQQLLDLRAEEDATLTTYGWVDETIGLARVPIDRAMDLLLETGLEGPATVAATAGDTQTGD